MLNLLMAAPVLAHGGFPESKDVQLPTGDLDTPVVVTSFGLLLPGSDGAWSWICEEVAGSTGVGASLATSDGGFLFATVDGVVRSDDGCAWGAVEGELDGLYVTSLTEDAATPGVVWATSGTSGSDNALWRSEDGGRRFEAWATFGDGSTVRGFLQGGSGLPLYAFGWRDGVPWMWSSEDGDAWSEAEVPLGDGALVYPLAVDAEDRALFRTPGGTEDALRRGTAGGDFEELGRFAGAVGAVDVGPDPDAIYVGVVDVGLMWSLDDGLTWSGPDEQPRVGCLVSSGDARFVCSHNWADGAAVLRGERTDGDPTAWTWDEVLWLGDVRGVLDCPADSTTALACEPLWEDVAAASGLDLEAAPEDTAGAEDSGGAATDKGSCGCAAANLGGGWALLAALVALVGRGRRGARRAPRVAMPPSRR